MNDQDIIRRHRLCRAVVTGDEKKKSEKTQEKCCSVHFAGIGLVLLKIGKTSTK